MKKAVVTLLVLVAIGGSGYAYYRYTKAAPAPAVTTAQVTRGDIVDRVGATGTLQAVTTVQVGTQVSGTIQNLYADFNSIVKKGQVLARLDPSLFQTQIEQARANLIRSQADLDRLKVGLDDARTKLARAKELSDRQLLPRSELDAADIEVRSAEAQIRSAQAQVTQAQASLNQNQVNLAHTVIEAPIDGLVISRNVDVGQTVAASMQAPTLFVLAADLTKMQVIANLDESDVGRIRPGQRVSFRVDAYPAEDFSGTVAQVRLQPIVQQNVVTYATVIDVPNVDLKLKPGMTANVNIEIAGKQNVLRVPNAALRFRPTNEIFAALGQTPESRPEAGRDAGHTSRGTAPAGRLDQSTGQKHAAQAHSPDFATANRTTPTTPDGKLSGQGDGRGRGGQGGSGEGSGFGGGRGGTDVSDAERARRMRERLQTLPPEQRDRMLERLRARGIDPTAADDHGSRAEPPPSRSKAQGSPAPAASARNSQATTIDALFGPLPPSESQGRVWRFVANQLKPVRVRLGITDGQATELIEGDLQEGAEVVTNVVVGAQTTRPAAGGTIPPFLGGRPPGAGGGGGYRGGGRGF
jgi:HlyD family secretion protein